MVFARAPRAGAVKTRLVPPLSAEQAAALHRAMTEDLLERLGGAFGEAMSLELRVDGDVSGGSFEMADDWTLRSQGAGDLGERLTRTARDAHGEGVERLVIVGSDAPLLPLPLVEDAFEAVGNEDAAIAPAEDGGYVLVGIALHRTASSAVARLFEGIPWGTGEVFPATRAAAGSAGIALAELPAHWDVDRPEDLDRLRREITALPPASRPRRTERSLADC